MSSGEEVKKHEVIVTPSKSSPTKKDIDIATQALNHFAQGKRHLLVNDISSAVNALQEACKLLAEHYGETAVECADAYFHYGIALLELARIESGVLGNALDGVPEGSDEENSQIEDPEKMTEDEKDIVSDIVGDALEENYLETEKITSKNFSNGTTTEVDGNLGSKSDSNKLLGGEEMELMEDVVEPVKSNIHLTELPVEDKPSVICEEHLVASEAIRKRTNPNEENETGEKATNGEQSVTSNGKQNLQEKSKDELHVEKERSENSVDKPRLDPEDISSEKLLADSTETVSKENVAELDAVETLGKLDKSVVSEHMEGESKCKGDNLVINSEFLKNCEATVEVAQKNLMSEEAEIDEFKKEGSVSEDEEDREDEASQKDEDGDSQEGDQEEEENEEENKGEPEGEKTDEEEDVSNLQLAWEMLELSKVIYTKQEASPVLNIKLAQVYLKLGEVSLENENYNQSLEDFTRCLEIQKVELSSDNRCLAETHYQLGVAHSFSDDFDKAMEQFGAAAKVIETRIGNLQAKIKEKETWTEEQKRKEVNELVNPFYTEQGEIDELEKLLPEIKEKLVDMEEMKKDSKEKLLKVKEAAFANILGGSKGASTSEGFTAAFSGNCLEAQKESFVSTADSKPATNITHLVRKKRKPEEEVVQDDLKKVKGKDGEAKPSSPAIHGSICNKLEQNDCSDEKLRQNDAGDKKLSKCETNENEHSSQNGTSSPEKMETESSTSMQTKIVPEPAETEEE